MSDPRPASAAVGHALPPGTRMAEFELQAAIGAGGFGIVYRGRDHLLERDVAVKEFMPASLARREDGGRVQPLTGPQAQTFRAGLEGFLKEARMLARFDHPSLVKVYRYWEANGTAYMAMPFYEGVTLRQALSARRTPVDEATLLGWLGPIADALAVLHAEHYFHRDVAPDNVLLLAGSGRPVLLDFGAARQVIGDLTQDLTVILKPGYAPIEQYADVASMKQGPWTDVYALGALAHAALLGRVPPPAVARMMNDTLEPLVRSAAGRCSEPVLRAIDHALVLRPEQRPQSIAAFKGELGLAPLPAAPAPASPDTVPMSLPTTVPAALPPPAPAPATTAPPAKRRAAAPPPPAAPSRRGLLIGAGGVALAGVGGALWWSGRAPAPASTPASAPATARAIAPTTTPAVPATTDGFDVAAAFGRIVAAQTSGWSVLLRAAATTLRAGSEALAVELRASPGGHVLAILRGSDGALHQWLPNAQAPAPRVAAGQALALPPAPFATAAAPGRMQLLVIVSRWPRDLTAFAPRADGGYASFPTGSVAAALEGANAGRLPLIAGRPQCPAGGPCEDAFGAAVLSVEVTG